MRVLIVEDNAFNAFCLRRLLESICSSIVVTIVTNSQAALALTDTNAIDLVILDGDLGADKAVGVNGPELSSQIWRQFPDLPLVAWTDSPSMLQAFSRIFRQHHKEMNAYTSWPKMINAERIRQTLAHHFDELIREPLPLPYYSHAGAW